MPTVRLMTLCLGLLALFTSNASAQQVRHGSIQKVDERNGSITIQDNTAGTNNANNSKKFAVQDGLLFNAVREGENVAYTVQEINGVNTIIKLEKD
jgi:Cu/Ag efflux protein CusF